MPGTAAGCSSRLCARAMAANLSQNGQRPVTWTDITSLVCSEITGVTTQLRADARASVSSYMGSSATIPRLQRNFKKARDVALHYGPGHDCMEYLEPFLDTIRCEETTGVVTQRALSAVHSFLRAELLSLNPASAPAAMVAVVKAATFCRFEVTDPAADEVRLPPPRPRLRGPPPQDLMAHHGCGRWFSCASCSSWSAASSATPVRPARSRPPPTPPPSDEPLIPAQAISSLMRLCVRSSTPASASRRR